MQLSVTPVSGNPVFSSGLHQAQCADRYEGKTSIHKIIIIKEATAVLAQTFSNLLVSLSFITSLKVYRSKTREGEQHVKEPDTCGARQTEVDSWNERNRREKP